jgi:hypothetical protein
MPPAKQVSRSRIPFDQPTPIDNKSKLIILDADGHICGELAYGILTIQTRKVDPTERQVIRINTNVRPNTFEISREKKKKT